MTGRADEAERNREAGRKSRDILGVLIAAAGQKGKMNGIEVEGRTGDFGIVKLSRIFRGVGELSNQIR